MKTRSVQSLVSNYDTYRRRTLNLIPSENVLSAQVLKALSSNMAGRYAGRPESYGGSGVFHEIWETSEELAKRIFHCRAASVSPISGHIAALMTIYNLCPKGGRIAVLSALNGGYAGYTEEFLPDLLGLKTSYLPYDRNAQNVDVNKALLLLKDLKPNVVILGATVFLFPHPVRVLAELVHSYGGKVMYDGSHVLGLIAGRIFQDPLEEGADVVTGSTHKTLFGPQGGMILSNDVELLQKIEHSFLYKFMDNIHLNRVGALAIALEEIKKHGRIYARNVIENSKTLAKSLASMGLPIAGASSGYTNSHQVLLTVDNGVEVRNLLESAGIIVDSRVRFGTNEVTRLGMGRDQMHEAAALIYAALTEKHHQKVKRRVFELTSHYRRILYTLD
jgi:glycine hydroxymethyltransferase